MKEYVKPECEVINFASEAVADVEQGGTYGEGMGGIG